MKAAKISCAEFVYPEYLMLCKLVQRVPESPFQVAAQTPQDDGDAFEVSQMASLEQHSVMMYHNTLAQ